MYGLLDNEIQNLKALFATIESIDKVVLYGSRARGNHRRGSDIDLALHSSRLSEDELTHLYWAIDDLDMPYRTEIVHFQKLSNDVFKQRIERDGKVFYVRKAELAS